MRWTDNEIKVTPSILDRLVDYEPRESRESPKSRSANLRELKAAVRRDLEYLLNSRSFPEEIPESLQELNKSVALYGLPDFTKNNIKNYSEQKKLTEQLEWAIRTFEPRLMDLEVTLDPVNDIERSLRFRILAQLKVDPVPEPIAFDTVLQMGSGEFEVKES
jgi:type VI secretion system protein ImpF